MNCRILISEDCEDAMHADKREIQICIESNLENITKMEEEEDGFTRDAEYWSNDGIVYEQYVKGFEEENK